MSKKIWPLIVDKIIAQRNLLLGDVELTILCDNLSFHRDVNMAKRLLDHKIYLYYLPPGTTHFTQPLDSTAFAVFKSALSDKAHKIASALQATGGAMKTTELLTAASCIAAIIGFSRERVVDSFIRTKFLPFDGDALLELARINVGVPESKKKSEEQNLRDRAQQVMQQMIHSHRQTLAHLEEGTQRVTVSATYGNMYDAQSLIACDGMRRRDEEYKEAAREEEKRTKELQRQAKVRAREEKVAANQAKRKERIAKKRAREEDIERRTCRAPGCSRKWTDVRYRGWLYCEYSDHYSLCPEHWSSAPHDPGQVLMKRHEKNCDYRRAKRARQK